MITVYTEYHLSASYLLAWHISGVLFAQNYGMSVLTQHTLLSVCPSFERATRGFKLWYSKRCDLLDATMSAIVSVCLPCFAQMSTRVEIQTVELQSHTELSNPVHSLDM